VALSASGRFEALAAAVIVAVAAASAGALLIVEPRPLTVVATQPLDGADGVPFRARILLTFSRPVDEGTVNGAVTVEPATEGFVSAAGRRVVFAPRSVFRADRDYRVTIGTGLRDRAGRSLREPMAIRFRTRGLGLVVRTDDGRLLRARLVGAQAQVAAEPLAGPGAGEFALSTAGDLAYVHLADGRLVIQPSGGAAPRSIPLPKSEVRDLAWAPGRTLIGFVAARRDGTILPYLIELPRAGAPVEPFGLPPDQIALNTSAVDAARKRSILERVHGRETFAFAPDGRGIIARDRKWDFVVFGFDGTLRGTLGPFLAVGNASPRGEFVALVDVDPGDGRLRRQVIVYERTGRLRPLSAPDRDSHSPRFSDRSDRVVYATAEASGPPEGRRFALETFDLSSGARRRLTEPPPGASDEDPQWSPDDGWITFRRVPVGDPRRGQVWIVRAEGGDARPLSVPGAVAARWIP